jgi:hypothetical protein
MLCLFQAGRSNVSLDRLAGLLLEDMLEAGWAQAQLGGEVFDKVWFVEGAEC